MIVQNDGHWLAKDDKSEPEDKIPKLIAIGPFLDVVCQEKERYLHFYTSQQEATVRQSAIYCKAF